MKPVLVVLNDLHSGSSEALMPEAFEDHKGNIVGQNSIQRWLWKCWMDAQRFVFDKVGGDPFSLAINGDAIEGVHHKTKQIISTEIGDHAACFEQVIRPIRERAAKLYMVLGTECHTGNTEMGLALSLGAEKNPAGGRTFDRLHLSAHGVPVVIKHHMSTSTRAWTDACVAELANEQIESVRNGEPMTRVLCTAHRHSDAMFVKHDSMVVVGAPWQMLTRHGHKVVGSARTKPGVYILDWRNRGHGELPEVHFRTYKAPQPARIKL